jgi:hypothetical protein
MSTTVRYARPPNTGHDAPARSAAPGHGNRCRCVRTNGTTRTSLRHLAPLLDGVEGIID